jgi:hypothetical protein
MSSISDLGTNLGLVLDLVILTIFMYTQVKPGPLKGFTLPIVLGVLGLLEIAAYLFGPDQLVAFLKGQTHSLALQYDTGVEIAIAGSLVLAAVTGLFRAPVYKIWLKDGQVWRKGTALTVILWIISLAVHLVYDAVVMQGQAYADLGDAALLLYFGVSLSVQRAALFIRGIRLQHRQLA